MGVTDNHELGIEATQEVAEQGRGVGFAGDVGHVVPWGAVGDEGDAGAIGDEAVGG